MIAVQEVESARLHWRRPSDRGRSAFTFSLRVTEGCWNSSGWLTVFARE